MDAKKLNQMRAGMSSSIYDQITITFRTVSSRVTVNEECWETCRLLPVEKLGSNLACTERCIVFYSVCRTKSNGILNGLVCPDPSRPDL